MNSPMAKNFRVGVPRQGGKSAQISLFKVLGAKILKVATYFFALAEHLISF